MEYNFDDIRCYKDEEVHDVLGRLCDEKQFMKVLSTIYPLMPKDHIRHKMSTFTSNYEFQREMVFPFLQYLEANMTTGVDLEGLDLIDVSKPYLFISNHRDIILDSALLCEKLIERNMNTVEIAIGDNLLIYPWIEDLVKVNKSFIVRRSLSSRQILESSKKLSAYIAYTINEKQQSIWIAQREGRAKDSNDRTQESLLKMFNMGGEGSFIENLTALNICPLSISYEYDPCDFLKAKEMQQKRDDANFKKNPMDDLINMETGVMGYKGKVVYSIAGCLNDYLKEIEALSSNRNEQISMTAAYIDNRIHSNYTIFANNKIAYDIVKEDNRFEKEYTVEEKLAFNTYINARIAKIDLENIDKDFLRLKMMEMYANPLINQLAASSKL